MSSESIQQRFAALLDEHRKIVFKVANTYCRDADDRADLVQEIAAQLWRAFPGYDPRRSFSTWMYRIALNVAISSLRSQRQRVERFVALDEDLHDIADDNAVDPVAEQQLRMLHGFIAELAPLDRALLLLYLEDRRQAEIADILGISESNVATKISRLKQRIRNHIPN
ncbi:MAG: sigma-70 family RNA polymerase sigma factor [Dokdonella sp.]